MSANEASSESKPITCGICGCACVEIRGRNALQQKRLVCPTCLADRMDQISGISSDQYGVAFAAELSEAEVSGSHP